MRAINKYQVENLEHRHSILKEKNNSTNNNPNQNHNNKGNKKYPPQIHLLLINISADESFRHSNRTYWQTQNDQHSSYEYQHIEQQQQLE